MLIVLFLSMFALFIFGVPIAISIGLASVIALLWDGSIPLLVVGQRLITSIDMFTLMAIPTFILAGTLMEFGGISKRLVNFANALTGHITGGLGLVAVVAAMFFAAISGSSAASVAAIGGILIPAMVNRGYHKDFSAALQAVSGELGIIIPPSIAMILYGVSTGTSIRDMFIAGIIPGIMIGVTLLIAVYVIAKKRGYRGDNTITWADRVKAFKEAILPLTMPVIILGGIYSGYFTPTEAGAVAALYAFIISVFVYKEIKLKDTFKILGKSAITSSIIMFIISSAGLFAWIISKEGLPRMAAEFFISISDSPFIFLILVNLFLLVVGMFLETSVSIIILAPILAPVAVQMGIDPVQFGMIMIVNLAIGMCTPPLGVNLFISCQIADISLTRITKAILPLLGLMILNLLLISYIPWLSTGLIELLAK
ncbi:TRAP transporter large permease [Sporosarcina sp. FSL W7-1349]|uniref:TRAP transporter large permease n=1 Tax=Sporosarcina sp. FSL W7-1349 TaxID=2921561 RepID=UPI0030FAA272